MSDGKSPIEKAKEALRPFAKIANLYDAKDGDGNDFWPENFAVTTTVSALRRAREALKALEGG